MIRLQTISDKLTKGLHRGKVLISSVEWTSPLVLETIIRFGKCFSKAKKNKKQKDNKITGNDHKKWQKIVLQKWWLRSISIFFWLTCKFLPSRDKLQPFHWWRRVLVIRHVLISCLNLYYSTSSLNTVIKNWTYWMYYIKIIYCYFAHILKRSLPKLIGSLTIFFYSYII